MALGVPPVAYNVGGLSEVVVNQTSGLLVSSGDGAAFARAAEELIVNASLRAALAEHAKERAKAFTAETTTRETERVYYQLDSGSEKQS
jgi:glycosyltransferase involved in cell wall biosynthesis